MPVLYSGLNLEAVMAITYKYNNNLYINLTNRCVMACAYCIKHKWKGKFRGSDLRLKKEPSAREVIKDIKDSKKYGKIIFCGYGEPLVRLRTLKAVALWVRDNGGKTRINTTGNFKPAIAKKMLKSLKDVINSMSISLNAPDAQTYNKINRPKYGIGAFDNVIEFIKLSRSFIPDTAVTAVALPGIETAKCRKIARHLKVKFRIRPYLDEYETN
jgi:TatD DNase family protein